MNLFPVPVLFTFCVLPVAMPLPLRGKQSASSERWAFNLLNVRTNPAHEPARQFYLTNYAYAGWGEGLA